MCRGQQRVEPEYADCELVLHVFPLDRKLALGKCLKHDGYLKIIRSEWCRDQRAGAIVKSRHGSVGASSL